LRLSAIIEALKNTGVNTDYVKILEFEKIKNYALQVNPNLQFFEVSATTGKGMQKWYKWLKENRI